MNDTLEDSNPASRISSADAAKIEYDQAMQFFRDHSNLRRQGLAFVTTVQGAILAVVGSNLSTMELPHVTLAVIGFFVAILGINNERRLISFSIGYLRTARQIEKRSGMSLLSDGYSAVKERRFIISNTRAFLLYYYLISIFWITLLAYNAVLA